MSLYDIAIETQKFIEQTIRAILQPKYECMVFNTKNTKHNIHKIYNRAENVEIVLERPSGKWLTIDDLTIEEIFALAISIDSGEYDITNPTIN